MGVGEETIPKRCHLQRNSLRVVFGAENNLAPSAYIILSTLPTLSRNLYAHDAQFLSILPMLSRNELARTLKRTFHFTHVVAKSSWALSLSFHFTHVVAKPSYFGVPDTTSPAFHFTHIVAKPVKRTTDLTNASVPSTLPMLSRNQ